MDILQLPGVQRTNGAVYNWDMTEIELKTFGERVTWLLRRRRQANQDIASQKELAAKIGMKPHPPHYIDDISRQHSRVFCCPRR